jgi:ribosomal protein L22
MSAEDEQNVAGETPEEPKAEKKPAAKKAAAKKPAGAKESAAAKGATGAKEPATDTEMKADAEAKADTEKTPAAKVRPAAKKAATKEPKEPAGGLKETDESKGKSAEEPAASEQKTEKKASRGGAAKAPRRRVVRAHARYVRTSARKARMVSGHLPGKTVGEARAILAFTPREVARDWSKLLDSAVANAENNHELLEDDLVVGEAYADEGPTIKRFRPRAMGRATPIHKRTSHLTITLTPGS